MADFDVAAWKQAKAAQFVRAQALQPNLTSVRYGPAGTVFMIVKSTPTFYEGIVYGQPPVRVTLTVNAGRRTHTRDAVEHEKPIDKRTVDLSDEQIDQIIALWADEKSARALSFVNGVYGHDGELQA